MCPAYIGEMKANTYLDWDNKHLAQNCNHVQEAKSVGGDICGSPKLITNIKRDIKRDRTGTEERVRKCRKTH